MTNQENQETKSKKETTEIKETKTTNFDELIQKAKEIGSDTVPMGTSEIEQKIIAMFSGSGKVLTAKQTYDIIKEKDPKYFSDKLWYLARKGILKKEETRGYYRISPDYKSE